MKIANALVVSVVAVALSLVGCGKKDEPKGEPTQEVAGKDQPQPDQGKEQPADEPPKEEEAPVVTTEDFEEEAGEEITADNLETELKKLEDELAEPEE
jgi:hypothetical protein